MEPEQLRIGIDLAKMGLMVFGGMAIFYNRKVVKPRLNSEGYNKVTLHVEHVLNH